MKTKILSLMAIVLTAITFTACSDDDKDQPGGNDSGMIQEERWQSQILGYWQRDLVVTGVLKPTDEEIPGAYNYTVVPIPEYGEIADSYWVTSDGRNINSDGYIYPYSISSNENNLWSPLWGEGSDFAPGSYRISRFEDCTVDFCIFFNILLGEEGENYIVQLRGNDMYLIYGEGGGRYVMHKYHRVDTPEIIEY